MTRKRPWKSGVLALAVTLLVAACTSGDDSGESADTTDGGAGASTETTAAATGPSPGVTDDTIKVGVTFVDASSLVASGLNYDLGEVQDAYQALFDQVNADGGINGRQLEPVFAPIDPTGPQSADEACVQLTEDEDVFIVAGFFLTDSVTCTVGTHATAVDGGEMTPERLDQAQAPWATPTVDTDLPQEALRAMAEQGDLDGSVAVYAAARDEEAMNQIIDLLGELGIDPVDTGVMDAPPTDQAAIASSVQTIAQRFDSSGADTVVLVGLSAQDWPTNMADNTSYRPTLLFLDATGLRAFATNAATTDTSVLEGAVAGGVYGPDQARYDEPQMQDCIATLEDAGVEVPTPESVGDDPSNQPYYAAFFACPDMALLTAWLDAAGEDLNYGTLANALDGLEVAIPGDPDPRTYGPPPAADGDPTAYLYDWDQDNQELVLREG
jgi:hypothetical protein